MKPTGRHMGDRGFTLIELLIALAMIGLITLLLFSGLRLGSRAWEAVEKGNTQTADLRLVQGFLMRSLNQVRVLDATFEAELIPVFGGDSERLDFGAPLSEHVGASGLYVLRLTLEGRGDGRALVLTRWLLHPEILEGGDDFPPWEPLEEVGLDDLGDLPTDMDALGGAFGRTLLLEDVRLFELAYYGVLDGETEPDWHEEWLAQSSLPALLQIRLTTTTQSWPDLLVALPAQVY